MSGNKMNNSEIMNHAIINKNIEDLAIPGVDCKTIII